MDNPSNTQNMIHQPMGAPPVVAAALCYQSNGWAVLPALPGSKLPMIAVAGASRAADQVLKWWDREPNANVAIATGAVSEVFVLDLEDPADGSNLPDTYRVTTPSGGVHHYFRIPDGYRVRNRNGMRFLGSTRTFDVRGDGGFVLAPPSVTARGTYTVERAGAIAFAPRWLLGIVADAQAAK